MKKILALMLCLVMLTGCSIKENTVELSNGKIAVITAESRDENTVIGTVTIENDVYCFEKTGRHYVITYPNDAVIEIIESTPAEWATGKNRTETVTGDISSYVSRDEIVFAINNRPGQPETKGSNPYNFFIGVLLIVAGLFNVITPETLWYMSIGWRIKNSQPTEEAVKFGRFAGVILMFVGITMVFTS